MEVQTTVWLELVASALTVFLMPFAAGACVEVYLLPERGSVSRAVGLLACLIVTAGAWWVL